MYLASHSAGFQLAIKVRRKGMALDIAQVPPRIMTAHPYWLRRNVHLARVRVYHAELIVVYILAVRIHQPQTHSAPCLHSLARHASCKKPAPDHDSRKRVNMHINAHPTASAHAHRLAPCRAYAACIATALVCISSAHLNSVRWWKHRTRTACRTITPADIQQHNRTCGHQ